ncbi:hypothetical protein HMPREF9446_01809 [Bacteroides fluxus YIT 12057]|uniref:Uncharacterized protein n=1 Tax=Bacteroides fluxus YIT 12057 TaxID=763034 RepID=F3PSU7_9BACE|nr:hypothetical protein HMPREF9446_01809 [Bacteroides fluxus YIT 12057]
MLTKSYGDPLFSYSSLYKAIRKESVKKQRTQTFSHHKHENTPRPMPFSLNLQQKP